METPKIKLIVRVCPKRAADARPVNIVATVDEYFFKIVSGIVKKHMVFSSASTVLNVRTTRTS